MHCTCKSTTEHWATTNVSLWGRSSHGHGMLWLAVPRGLLAAMLDGCWLRTPARLNLTTYPSVGAKKCYLTHCIG